MRVIFSPLYSRDIWSPEGLSEPPKVTPLARGRVGGRAIPTQVCLTLCFYSARRHGGPPHLLVIPFTPLLTVVQMWTHSGGGPPTLSGPVMAATAW